MITNLSFCITRYTAHEAMLRRCLASISKQRVPHSEIIVCGDGASDAKIRFLQNSGWTKTGELSKTRNVLCSNAAEPFVVLMADHVELSDGWYEAIKEADCFDIIGSRLVTEDNARAIDWAYRVKLGSKHYPFPLEYDEWTTKAYVTGDLMLLRKSAWEQLKFNQTLKR